MDPKNGSTSDPTPLLEDGGYDGGDHELVKKERWWNKVMDMEEAKDQVLFSLPMITTNVAYYGITLISVMYAGHLGELQLAGATLANSWAMVTGLALMVGLSGAVETLCGQAYGANIYSLMGIYLQASCIISLFFSVLVSILWIYTEPILVFLHQDSDIAKTSALYIKYLIPGIFAYGILQNILRFLQMQSVVWPLVVCSLVPLAIQFGIAYVFIHFTALGFRGAALAASVSLWLSCIMLAIYVLYAKKFEETWKGFSIESVHYIFVTLKLALSSAAMVCLEYWAFEILVLLAGLMSDAEISTSLIAMCVNTEAIAYMTIYGLSAAASTRVSNELGAGNPDKAKHAAVVTLKLSILLALIILLALGFGHNIWASFFSSSQQIIQAFASMTPLLLISILFDSVQGVLSGVARGCGWQHLVMYANLAMFYIIGMPVACLLAFLAKLETKGLWIGLICGLFCQTGTLLLITLRTKWNEIVLSVDSH